MLSDQEDSSRSTWKRNINLYQSAVLVGNWFEERCSNETDPKAITPGIYGKSGCLDDATVYKNDFINPIEEDPGRMATNFFQWKQEGFGNRLNGEFTNFTLGVHDAYLSNLPSITRTTYRRLKAQKNHDEDYVPKQGKRQKVDNLHSHDVKNPNTRLLRYHACKNWMEHYPYDLTHYREKFAPKSVVRSPADLSRKK